MPSIAKTPASMYSFLCTLFSANVAATDGRKAIVADEVVDAAKWVWYFARWKWRRRVVSVTTTANQAWSTLPADFAGEEEAGDWLVESGSRIERPTYVAARNFDAMAVFTDVTTRQNPFTYTTDMRVISTVPTPVIRWQPTPAAAATYDGFQYAAAMTGFDVTGAAAIFPYDCFDTLWKDAAIARIGRMLSPAEEGVRVFSMAEVQKELEDAVAKWASERIQTGFLDKMRDADDQPVTFWSGGPRRDTGGGLMTG